jgi:hypothetical protein
MSTLLQKRLAPFSKLSREALLGTNGYFFIFGDGAASCLYIDGQITTKPKKETILPINTSGADFNESSDKLKLLVRKAATVLSLKYEFIGSGLSISFSKWTSLNRRMKELNATHIQFEGDAKEIRVYPFDIRALVGSSSMRQSYISGANGLYLKKSHLRFQFTVLADAWLKLPLGSASLDFSNCGILRLEYSENGIRVNIRDQEIRRPHTAFYSSRIKRRVLFLFHPKGSSTPTSEEDYDVQG